MKCLSCKKAIIDGEPLTMAVVPQRGELAPAAMHLRCFAGAIAAMVVEALSQEDDGDGLRQVAHAWLDRFLGEG